MSAAKQLPLFDEPDPETIPVTPDGPASIAMEIATSLATAAREMDAEDADLAPSWSDTLMERLADMNARAERELQDLRALHAEILGCDVADLDRILAEEEAKRKAEAEAWKAGRPTPSARPSRRRSMAKAGQAADEATAPTKRLTDRQRELVALVAVEGNVARYTREERIPDWSALKAVMLALGAKWRSRRGFVFPDDVDGAEMVRVALESGEVIDWDGAGFFPTPDGLADALVARLVEPIGGAILEPSAGDGALVRAVRRRWPRATIQAVELIDDNRAKLEAAGVEVIARDFLALDPASVAPFGAVVMNPPFAKRADVHHIQHALRFLRPGGQLVAIASAGVLYRDDALGAAFRGEIEALGGAIEPNPDGSFAASGTQVRTVSVWCRKEAE